MNVTLLSSNPIGTSTLTESFKFEPIFKTSAPIIVYRETVGKESTPAEGRSPNKHNSFFITVEPLEDEVYEAIQKGEIHEKRYKKKDEQLTAVLQAAGITNDEIKNYRDIYKGNVILDETRGEVHMVEVIEMIMDG